MASIAILAAVQVGLAFASAALTPKPKQEKVDRGKQDDIRFTIVEEGAFIPRVYGLECRLGGALFWGTETEENANSTPGSSGGKKGRGATPPTTTFSYIKSFAAYICEGPVRAITEIKEGDKVIFNQPSGSTSAYLDAESPGNTLAGGASIVADATLLSGAKVTLPPGASVQFNAVRSNATRSVDLGIYYQSDHNIPIRVRVNNTTNYDLTLADSNNELNATDQVIDIASGPSNTIKITNQDPTNSVHVDRIFVFPFFLGEEVTEVVDESIPYPTDLDDPRPFYNRALRVDGDGRGTGTISSAGQANVELFLGTRVQTQSSTISTIDGPANTPAYRGLTYVAFKDYQIENGQLQNLTFKVEPLLSDLADILIAEHQLRGSLDSELDFEALRGTTVESLYIDRLAPLTDTLEALKFLFNFDIIDLDGKITAVPRGGSSLRTIPLNELLAHDGDSERPQGVKITYLESADLPQGVYVAYIDPNNTKDFHTATQFVPLDIDTPALEAETINLPLGISDSDQIVAAGKAWLHGKHLEKESYDLNLAPDHSDLTATDVVTIELAQRTLDVRLLSTQTALPGITHATAVPERAGLFNQIGLGQIGTGTETPVVRFPANSFLWLGDLPLLAHEDDRLRWLAGACPRGPGSFQGTYVSKEIIKDSDDFQHLFPIQTPATLGHLVNALDPITDVVNIDRTSSCTIDLLHDDGSLASVPESDITGRPVNQFALGSGDGCEIIRAATVTPAAASAPYVARYVLTNLLRGLYGTEASALAGHDDGKTVALLNDSIKSFTEDVGELQRTRTYKAVTVGQAVVDAPETDFTFLGYSKKPYAVANIRRIATADDGAAIVGWSPRTRIAGLIHPQIGASLSEEKPLFRFAILDPLTDDILFTEFVETGLTLPVPWLLRPADDLFLDDRYRTDLLLDPYSSSLELTMGDYTGAHVLDLWDQNYYLVRWAISLVAGDFSVSELDPVTGSYNVKFTESLDPDDLGNWERRVRVVIANGTINFYIQWTSPNQLPNYTSAITVPTFGPLRPEIFSSSTTPVPSAVNAVAIAGGHRYLVPASVQEDLLGDVVDPGDLKVQIIQYSQIVGQGFPAVALI